MQMGENVIRDFECLLNTLLTRANYLSKYIAATHIN